MTLHCPDSQGQPDDQTGLVGIKQAVLHRWIPCSFLLPRSSTCSLEHPSLLPSLGLSSSSLSFPKELNRTRLKPWQLSSLCSTLNLAKPIYITVEPVPWVLNWRFGMAAVSGAAVSPVALAAQWLHFLLYCHLCACYFSSFLIKWSHFE